MVSSKNTSDANALKISVVRNTRHGTEQWESLCSRFILLDGETWDDPWPCPHDLFRIFREKFWKSLKCRFSKFFISTRYTQQKRLWRSARVCVCYQYGRGLARGAQLHHREAHTLRFTFSQPRLAEETQKTMQVCGQCDHPTHPFFMIWATLK